VNREEQLSWEARVGRPVAAAAFVSAALLVVSTYVTNKSGLGTTANDSVDFVFHVHDHKGAWTSSSILQGFGLALLSVPLWFLYRAAAFRRKEVPSVARYLAFAPVLAGLLQTVHQLQTTGPIDRIHASLTQNPRPPNQANDFVKHELGNGATQILGAVGIAAGLGLAFAFVLISLHAMRAGLLSRFMGILGIIVGVLFIVPLLSAAPVVMIFWIVAIGVLALGVWPQGGRGPAWDTGEPIPWPTAADRQRVIAEERADREAAREEAGQRPRTAVAAGRRPAPEPALEDDDEDDESSAARRASAQHPRSKKRKRKRR
jgi:hypothetical protein